MVRANPGSFQALLRMTYRASPTAQAAEENSAISLLAQDNSSRLVPLFYHGKSYCILCCRDDGSSLKKAELNRGEPPTCSCQSVQMNTLSNELSLS